MNLLPNYGFEVDTDLDGLADDLTTYGTITTSLVASDGTTGNCQRMIVAAGDNADVHFAMVPATAGLLHTLETWRRIASLEVGGQFVLKVEWYDATPTLVNYDYIADTTVVGALMDLTAFSFTSTPGTGATQGRVVLAIEGGGFVDIDDVSLTPDTPPPVNDNRDDAVDLPTAGTTVGFGTSYSTRETDEMVDVVGDNTAGTIWFRYVPTGPGTLDLAIDLTDGVIEVYDVGGPLFTDLALVASGQDAVSYTVAGGNLSLIRVHAENLAGEDDGRTITYGFTARVQDFAVSVTADLPVAPGTLSVSVTQGVPDEDVEFNLIGYGTNPIFEDVLDPTGQLLSASVPVPATAAGTYTLEAVTASFTATVDFEVLTDPATDPSIPATIPVDPPAIVPIQRWVLQDPVPGGTATYTFPNNPAEMTSPHPARTITPGVTVAQSGQDLMWQGSARPHAWSFNGYAATQAFQEALLSYVELNRRFYLIDHRRRAWEVSFESFDISQRNDPQNFWAVDYTVAAIIYSGPVDV